MIKAEDVNLAMVKQVAELLGPLRKDMVFLGGAATGLWITDDAAPKVRATKDIDLIVEILSRSGFIQIGGYASLSGVCPAIGGGRPHMPMAYWRAKC